MVNADIEYQTLDFPTLKTTFGSSGNLSRQILQGAPFCVFLSADTGYVERLQQRNRLISEPVTFATGSIALIARPGSRIANAIDTGDWQALLRNHDWKERLAIANPRHAPYGVAAQQVLDAIGAPATLRPLQAENAAQALQFVLSGGADAALVPRALTLVEAVAGEWAVMTVDERLYKPVLHVAALVKPVAASSTPATATDTPSSAARQLLMFLVSPQASAILSAGGFDPAR